MKQNTLWVEQFRPVSLDTYVGNEGVKTFIAKCIEENDIPHLLLYGRPGTGKTTLAQIITKNINCDMMYINASDERGIDTIRDKIIGFASSNSFNPIKIIVLDEADQITPTAMGALRNIMETFSMKTRFILTANYIERIIDPIKSRCQSFHIEPPTKSEVAKHLVGILDSMDIEYKLPDLATIIKTYYPDIRKIINTTQQSVGKDKVLCLGNISADTEETLTKIIKLLKNKDKNTWSEVRQVIADAEITDFVPYFEGLYLRVNEYTTSPADVAIHLAQYLWQNNSIDDRELNFMACLSQIIKIK